MLSLLAHCRELRHAIMRPVTCLIDCLPLNGVAVACVVAAARVCRRSRQCCAKERSRGGRAAVLGTRGFCSAAQLRSPSQHSTEQGARYRSRPEQLQLKPPHATSPASPLQGRLPVVILPGPDPSSTEVRVCSHPTPSSQPLAQA